MSYTAIPPCEELKDYVSHFWTADWDEQIQDTNSTYFVTANTLTEIAFGFTGTELLFSSIQGQTDTPNQFFAGGFYRLFGVSLYSFAVPYLFHLPAVELNNHFMSPEVLLGNDGILLTEKIAFASNDLERIKILTTYFKKQLRKHRFGDSLISNAALHIKQHNGNLNMEDLAGKFCLSQKQFERRFKANTGFNPKLYSRIVRFEKILNSHNCFPNLTAASYAGGYYDQAHFIRDFKSFAGYSPNKFFDLSGY